MIKKLSLVLLAGVILLGLTTCQKEPTASFTASKLSVEVGETVIFTNTSTEGHSYEWDFGDGAKSSSESGIHTYTKTGSYVVSLTVFSKNGKKSDKATNIITVAEPTASNNSKFTVNATEYPITQGFIEYYGQWCGTQSYNFDISFLSSGFNVNNVGGQPELTGSGDHLYFEAFTSNENDLANGTYNFNNACDAFTFSDNSVYVINFNMSSSTYDSYGYIDGGSIAITKTGSVYEVTMTLSDEHGNDVTGLYQGPLDFFDSSKKSSTSKKRFSNR